MNSPYIPPLAREGLLKYLVFPLLFLRVGIRG